MQKRWMSVFLSSCMALTLVPSAALATEETDTADAVTDAVIAEAPEIAEAVVDVEEAPEVAQMNEETAAAKLEEVTVEIPDEMKAAVNAEEAAEAPEIAEMEVEEPAALLEPVEEADAPEEVLAVNGNCGKGDAEVTWTLINGTLTISGKGAMQDYSENTYVPWYNQRGKITTVNIGSGVTSIGRRAFINFNKLESIKISSGVTSIGEYAFYGCDILANIEIPSSVTSIGAYAFYCCWKLESIEIPSSVTSIGNYAFYNCNILKSIALPKSLTSIGKYAFGSCPKLKDVYYAGTEADWMKISISGNAGFFDATIHFNSNGSGSGDSDTVDYSNVVPQLTSVTVAANGLTVNWNAASDLTLYRVYRRTAGTSWKKLKDVAATSYTDTTAVNGTTYYYTVRGMLDTAVVTSYDKTGLSETYVNAPEMLGILKINRGLVPVWDAIPGVTRYRVYRKVSGGSWVALKDVLATSYVDTTAKSGTTYYYTVRGMNGTVIITSYDKTGVSATR